LDEGRNEDIDASQQIQKPMLAELYMEQQKEEEMEKNEGASL